MSRTLKLYRISQNENDGWDTYDSAVVAAYGPDEAAAMNPGGKWEENNIYNCWASKPDNVTVEYIGDAFPDRFSEPQFIISSFNAG